MTLEADVANVLRTHPVDRISFKIETIAVNKTQMELVAKKIDSGDIAVTTGGAGPKLGAAYSSYVGRRVEVGEKKLIGKIALGGPGVVKTALGKAAIFHESVHALIDVSKVVKLPMQDDEVVAYLADAMYLKSNHTNVGGGPLEMAIFKAAFAIIDAHQMLIKQGVALKWTDCATLRDAINAHPAYHE